MSKLEKIDEDIRIPYDKEAIQSGNPLLLADYLLKMIKVLQELLEQITAAANYAIDLSDGEAVYYALRQSDGTYPDGTWRRIQVGDNLEDQVKINGTWTLAHRRERPV